MSLSRAGVVKQGLPADRSAGRRNTLSRRRPTIAIALTKRCLPWPRNNKVHAAGVDVELEIRPEVPHAFQIAEFLLEAILAIDHIAHFVQRRTG